MSSNTPASPDSDKKERSQLKLVVIDTVLAAVVVAGLIITGIVSWNHAGNAQLWALAWLAVGAFGGLLFGIPKMKQSEPGKAVASANDNGVQPQINNNLIEVSDWLTKIIVGLGLVQLHKLSTRLKEIADPLARCLGGDCGLSIALGVLIFFVTAGFLLGYINARTFLAVLIRESDDELLRRQVEALKQDLSAIEDSGILPGNKQSAREAAPKFTEAFAAESKRAEELGLGRSVDPEDPNKGRFGGRPDANGRLLEAEIQPLGSKNSSGCGITIRVRSTDPARPLTGKVRFFLHPSFKPEEREYFVNVHNGVAEDYIRAWGAFTVGVLADDGKTKLELDLKDVDGGTKKFYLY